MLVERIYDEDLSQAAWLIGCQATGEALLIDPERDICRYLEIAEQAGLAITAVTETHIHADFLSGCYEFATSTKARCYLSEHGGDDWSYTWPKQSGVPVTYVKDGDTFSIGNISVTVVHTPGHTPEHISFLIHDANTAEPIGYATGDFVFVGDLGRPDLLETAAGLKGAMVASAQQLHTTCQRFLEMEDYVQIWPAHGAGSSCGKALGAVSQTTVGYEKRTSPPLQYVGDEQAFVDFMLADQPEPPLYFARMKQMNRDGIPLLGALPVPRKIESATELFEQSKTKTVIDTRPWDQVRDGYLPNTIWSKANSDFHRFAGSYLRGDENIILIVSQGELDRAIRNAIRIGIDNIVAWAEPELLHQVDGLDTMKEITALQFEQMDKVHVLDVRRLIEFEQGSISGAINIAHTRLFDRLSELDKGKEWVVNCHAGSRSAAACMALKQEGFSVTNLAGGYKGWKEHTNCSLA